MTAEGEETVPAQIEDPDRYVERRRLKSILDSREIAEEEINRAQVEHTTGNISEAGLNRMIFTAVQQYIRNLRIPLLEHEAGTEYWEETDLGVIEIPPPDAKQIAWDHKKQQEGWRKIPSIKDTDQFPRGYRLSRTPGQAPAPGFSPISIKVRGLKEFLELSPPISYNWTISLYANHKGDVEHTVTKATEVPRKLSMTAFDAGNEFAGEIGLDIEAEPGDAGFDYEDLIEEGPPGTTAETGQEGA